MPFLTFIVHLCNIISDFIVNFTADFMKSMLKYILPLLCFVALIGCNEEAVRSGDIGEAMPEMMTVAGDACISTDDAECIPIRPTSSVNSGQRVQKHSRQSHTSQRRCGTFLKAGRVVHLRLYDNTYINQHLRLTVSPFTVHRLISWGRLVI